MIPTVSIYYTLFDTFVKWFWLWSPLCFTVETGGGFNTSGDFLYIRHAAFNISHHHLLLIVTHFHTLLHTHYGFIM